MTNFKPSFNQQLGKISPSPIRAFDERCSKIPGMLKLTLGEPDFNTPEHVKAAGIKGIEENQSHYTVNAGNLPLREAVSVFFKEKYNLNYQAESEILVTVGATEAYAASLLAILNPGDKVLIPSPAFPGYQPVVTMAGAEVIHLDTSVNDFILAPTLIEAAMAEHGDGVKAIILNYPSNPTGVTYSRSDVEKIATTLKKYNIFVISDEIYSELTYGEPHVSIAEYLPEQTILISGLSKSHAMTGWRIGFVLAPAVITQEISKPHQFLVTASTSISQAAALAAMTSGKNDGQLMKKHYQERRDYLCKKMRDLGFEVAEPTGAFYVFAKIPKGYQQNSLAFCEDLATKKLLALVPGSAFGPGGEGYVRVSYAADMATLIEAMSRLEAYLAENK